MKHSRAIAFDFDGTLVRTGHDKGLHIIYASWVACAECGLEGVVHGGDDLAGEVDRIVTAYLRYPGAPRFQQLAAIVNSLVNNEPTAFDDVAVLGAGEEVAESYGKVRARYNEIYSGLNDIAAEKYWGPFSSVKRVLQELSQDHDLFVASGVTQDILEGDFDKHGFDRDIFDGIYGGNLEGGNDKGEILKELWGRGYWDLLFVADSNKDLEYAIEADARFYRIEDDDSYGRLMELIVAGERPNQREYWTFTAEEEAMYRREMVHPLEQ